MASDPMRTTLLPLLLEQPAERLLALLESRPSRSMIALAGMPGAGKTTQAARLADAVNTHTTPDTMLAHGIGVFHLSKAARRQFPDPEKAFARRGAPLNLRCRCAAPAR